MLQQLINWLYAHQREIIAICAGILISWGMTQRIKFAIPKKWSRHAREVATQSLAFLFGMVATIAVWPPHRGSDSIVAGLVVGLVSPAAWNIGTLIIGFKWPWLKPVLSQNVRKGEKLDD